MPHESLPAFNNVPDFSYRIIGVVFCGGRGNYLDAMIDRDVEIIIYLGFALSGFFIEAFLVVTGSLLVSYAKARTAALSAYIALGCRGASRVDLRLDTEGQPYVLEVNTIPGMTETSLLPKIARLAGYDFPDLIEEMLRGILYEDK